MPSSASISPPPYLRLWSHKVTRVNAFAGSWESSSISRREGGRHLTPPSHAGCPQLQAPTGPGPDLSRCPLVFPPPSASLPASPPPDGVFLPFPSLLAGLIQQRFTRAEKGSGDTAPCSIFVSLSGTENRRRLFRAACESKAIGVAGRKPSVGSSGNLPGHDERRLVDRARSDAGGDFYFILFLISVLFQLCLVPTTEIRGGNLVLGFLDRLDSN